MKRLLQTFTVCAITFLLISCGDDGPAERDPMISEISPESGPPGTAVTISGSDFSPEADDNTVTFDGTEATVSEADESELQAEVPEDAESGPVEVTVDGNTASGPQFTVEEEAPGISSVEPDSGTAGTEVTIKGENFSSSASENTITFNGTDAPVNGAAEDQLMTEVPNGATDGPVEVTVDGETATGPDFDVITEGTLKAITTTGGDSRDDSYELTVNGMSESIGAEDTVHISELEEDTYQAELSDVVDNCSVDGDNPRDVEITAGDTTATTFEIDCQAVLKDRIVFHSMRDGDFGDIDIFSMNSDGSDPQKIINTADVAGSPAVSNDAQQIAFVSDKDGDYALYTMNVDGSEVENLTVSNYFYDGFHSWSPDDSKLVYTGVDNGEYTIHTVNSDGSGQNQVTPDTLEARYPSWSPDGDKIAFAGVINSGSQEIFTINPDGSELTQITDDSLDATYNIPAWSPDGEKIAFVRNRDGSESIYTMNNDGTGWRQVTNDSGDDLFPSWSSDGTELVFQTDRDGDKEIYKINADGSGTPVNLTANSAEDGAPYWSPVE